jgi:hypothetical protein
MGGGADPNTLMLEIEQEYIKKVRAKSQAEVPTFKAGDKILITKYISLQKEKFEEIMVPLHTPHPPPPPPPTPALYQSARSLSSRSSVDYSHFLQFSPIVWCRVW